MENILRVGTTHLNKKKRRRKKKEKGGEKRRRKKENEFRAVGESILDVENVTILLFCVL